MKRYIWITPFIIVCLLVGGWTAVQVLAGGGLTLTVNMLSDISDMNPGDGICDVSVNAGDQCNLRAAIEELNALGPDTTPYHIEFDLAGTGPFTITPGSPLPDITVPLEIDGETQPGAACPTNSTPATLMIVLDGTNAGTDTHGFHLLAGSEGGAIRGLVIGNFARDGIRIESDDHQVRCNHIGLGADGVSTMANGWNGVFIYGANNTIGGLAAGQRNVISGNGQMGLRLESVSENNIIRNNFIGSTADGQSALPNGDGIYLSGNNNTIGGSAPSAGNVISGNEGFGIRVNNGDSNLIQGNTIGVARDGVTPLPNQFSDGVELLGGAIGNVVGGTAVGEANIIAHNGGFGVLVDDNVGGMPGQNRIQGNNIFDNLSLGIDLGGDGVDVNDAGDGDSGENEHQNYPVLLSVPGSATITVTLNSQANTDYSVDLFRNDSCDPSGHGEGQEYLGTGTVTTDAAGYAEEIVNLGGAVSSGDSMTAVATDPTGNSSEFSACVIITLPVTPTPTATGTITPDPSPTPEVTPTAVPPEFAIYLPAIIRE
jgi:hypothetical protein